MAKEKKFADEVLSDEELDGVAGGTRLETYSVGNEFAKKPGDNLNTENNIVSNQSVAKSIDWFK